MSDENDADQLRDRASVNRPGKGQGTNPAVKTARKKRYSWPPPPDPDEVYVPKERNPIHSILTALPIIMLVAGLYIYYDKESEQTDSAPIFSETIEAAGVFTGLSVVKSGAQGRHYLWFEDNGSSRGVRIKPEQAVVLQALSRGEVISLKIAPTVHESKTYWAWYVEQSGQVLIDTQDALQ